jgi:hypothetical protein
MFDTVDPNMAAYNQAVDAIGVHFAGFEFKHIDRRLSEPAGALSRYGSSRSEIPPGIFLEHLHKPSVPAKSAPVTDNPTTEELAVLAVSDEIPEWTKPFLAYLSRKELPEDDVTARQIVRRATTCTIINGLLYKRSTKGIFLRCVSPEEGQRILRDMHEDECRHHASSRMLVSKAFRHGFFWLMAQADAKKIVDYCISCQKYKSQPQIPASALKTIPIT